MSIERFSTVKVKVRTPIEIRALRVIADSYTDKCSVGNIYLEAHFDLVSSIARQHAQYHVHDKLDKLSDRYNALSKLNPLLREGRVRLLLNHCFMVVM